MNSALTAAEPNPQKLPLLSIAVPCHKLDPLLDRALGSCLPLAGRADLEVIVSWNSTDTEAFHQLRARYPGFRWYQPPSPLSMGANWDYCMQQAQGEWGLVLSYDDQLVPERLLAMLPTLAACEADVGAYFGLSAIEDATYEPPKLTIPAREFKRLWKPQELWMQMPWGTPVHLPAALFRIAAWQMSEGFDNALAFACDVGVWERIARHHAIWVTSDRWSIYRWHAYTQAAVQAAHNDGIRMAADFNANLRTWDVFGQLICWFGYSRQVQLSIQMNPEYQASVMQKFSVRDRLLWDCFNGLERMKIGRHLVSRLVFRLLLGLWRWTAGTTPGRFSREPK